MTVEERAKTVTDEVGIATTGAQLRTLIAQALRDQTEDCAQIADQESDNLMAASKRCKEGATSSAGRLAAATIESASIACRLTAKKIRALAAPKEEEKPEEDGMGFFPGFPPGFDPKREGIKR